MKTKVLHGLIGTVICLALVFGISLPAKAALSADLQAAILAAINDNAADIDAMVAALEAIMANPDNANLVAEIAGFAVDAVSKLKGITADTLNSIATTIANAAITAGAPEADVVAAVNNVVPGFSSTFTYTPPAPAAGGEPGGWGPPDPASLEGGRPGS